MELFIGKGGGRVESERMDTLPPPPPPTENMVEIQGDGNGIREERARPEEKRM